MNLQPVSPPENNLSEIAKTIAASAQGEEVLSPEEQLVAVAAYQQEQEALRISPSDYENLLKYILWTISAIGFFFIVGSLAASFNENRYSSIVATMDQDQPKPKWYTISDSLLGLGTELLASVVLVVAISHCMTKEGTPKSATKEKVLIYSCLGIGLLLLSVPTFMTESSWCRSLMQSAGCELFGGGILITLFENLERKFRS